MFDPSASSSSPPAFYTASNSLSEMKKWFAVSTIPRHEKQVREYFRVVEIECYLPLLSTPCRWKDGSRKMVQLPLFPSYIFARIARTERGSVLAAPGVRYVVGSMRDPLPISDHYVQALQEGLRQGKIEKHPYLTVGTKVRIRRGVMAGLEGLLQRKQKNLRVVLTLEAITQSVSVEVLIDDIEVVDKPCPNDPSWLGMTG